MRRLIPLAALNAAVLVCGVLAAGAVDLDGPTTLAKAAPSPSPSAVSASPSVLPSPSSAAPSLVPSPEPAPAASTAAPRAVETPAAAPTTQAPAPPPRTVTRTAWRPYATVGPVTLHFPGDVVEVLGLHQSGHDGAQPQQPVENDVRKGLLDSRSRGTNPQGAADIVVDPTRPVRSPVTGTVLRAGTYTLYCDHVDQYVVVEPAARPGWEVKLLHFEGLAVGEGDRLEAGVTVVGSRARVLPFASQVDKHTASPHWPHVHVEVVDPSIPDRPSGGSCD